MREIRNHVALALVLASLAALSLGAADNPTRWQALDGIFGIAGKDLPGGVHRFGWPRRDLHVQIAATPIQPALALGSWAAFVMTGTANHAMAMGDLVLLESEVTPVLSTLQAGGIDITAIHNHLIGEQPPVVYLHFSGAGDPSALATTLQQALSKTATPTSGPLTPPAQQPADDPVFGRLQAAVGRQGTVTGSVLQIGVPRGEKVEENGMEIPASMGISTALNFERVGEQIAATGDFVLVAGEVNAVIRELQTHGVEVTALHSHMLAERPRLFFVHFWGVGSPETIGGAIKAALAKVNTKR